MQVNMTDKFEDMELVEIIPEIVINGKFLKQTSEPIKILRLIPFKGGNAVYLRVPPHCISALEAYHYCRRSCREQ